MNSGYSPIVDPGSLRLNQELNAIIDQKRAIHEQEVQKHAGAAAGTVRTTLEEAAQAAAIADGVVPTGVDQTPKAEVNGKLKKSGLRRGKWTPEEEAYAQRLIHEFKSGLLPLTDGTTLRTFLSKLLNCDPMRISKKFVGHNCIGKQVFRRRQGDLDKLTQDSIEKSRRELAELERRFLERVTQSSRTKTTPKPSGQQPAARAEGNSHQWLASKDTKAPPTQSGAQGTATAPSRPEGRSPHLPEQPVYPTHTLPWMPPGAALPLPYGMIDPTQLTQQEVSSGMPAQLKNPHLHKLARTQPTLAYMAQAKAAEKMPPGMQARGTRHKSAPPAPSSQQSGYPSSGYDAAAAHMPQLGGASSFPRTPSMEVLASLGLPSVGSIDNLSAFGMSSFTPSSYPPPAALAVPWDPYHQNGYDMAAFAPHPAESGLASYNHMKSYPTDQPDYLPRHHMKRNDLAAANTGMYGQSRAHMQHMGQHNTSVDDFLALVDGGDIPAVEHDQLTSVFTSVAPSARSRASNAGFDARLHGPFQEMNKMDTQTSGKRRYDAVGAPPSKLARNAEAVARADV